MLAGILHICILLNCILPNLLCLIAFFVWIHSLDCILLTCNLLVIVFHLSSSCLTAFCSFVLHLTSFCSIMNYAHNQHDPNYMCTGTWTPIYLIFMTKLISCNPATEPTPITLLLISRRRLPIDICCECGVEGDAGPTTKRFKGHRAWGISPNRFCKSGAPTSFKN